MPRLLLCVIMLTLCGCAGYRLGPTADAATGGRSIQIASFSNQTLEPRLTDAVTSQLRKRIQRDGTYKLATQDDADIHVTGKIIRYYRNELSFRPRDIVTVRDYRITMTAHVTAHEKSTGRILIDQPVSGFTLVRVGSDLVSTERQALPLLAADLAKNITDILVDGTW